MKKSVVFEAAPGVLLAIIVGIISVKLATLHLVLDSLVVAILFGMIFNFLLGTNETLRPGIVLAPRIFIPLGIIFYAKNLNFLEFSKVPFSVLVQLVIIMSLSFLTIYYTGRKLGIRKKTTLLLGTGTAICGASAIAITSPVVEAEPEDTSVALVVITIAALVGVLIFPTIMSAFSLNDKGYTILAASTLHMTGIVKTVVSGLPGNLKDLAVSIKLMRVALLILVVPILSYVVNRKFYVHWFIIVFAMLGVVYTYNPSIRDFVYSFVPFSGYFFPIALGSIGLNTNLSSVLDSGVNPLLAGLLGFVAGVAIFLLGTLVIQY